MLIYVAFPVSLVVEKDILQHCLALTFLNTLSICFKAGDYTVLTLSKLMCPLHRAQGLRSPAQTDGSKRLLIIL